MTLLMPTCLETVARLTDYEEGALGPLDWFGLKLHLSLCPPCRHFLKSLHRTPSLLREFWADTPEPAAEKALAATLAALREGRLSLGPRLHPAEEAWQALAPGGDPLTALLLRVHLGHCEACRGVHGSSGALGAGQDPIGSLRPLLPPEERWRWTRRGLGGAQVARLVTDPLTGATLNLAHMPAGRAMPHHGHCGPELSLVLAGALQDGATRMGPGDWIAHGPGDQHGPAADRGGECWALIRLEGGLRFTGWRSLLGAVG